MAFFWKRDTAKSFVLGVLTASVAFTLTYMQDVSIGLLPQEDNLGLQSDDGTELGALRTQQAQCRKLEVLLRVANEKIDKILDRDEKVRHDPIADSQVLFGKNTTSDLGAERVPSFTQNIPTKPKISTQTPETDSKKKMNGQVKRVVLIGERNSGTKWIFKHLKDCYSHRIKVEVILSRYKHWFQDEHVKPGLPPIVVVSMFRNPYDWVDAMRTTPFHSSDHEGISDWQTFVTKPWNREGNKRYAEDLALEKTMTSIGYDKSQIPCQEHFTYQEINSCVLFPYAGKKRAWTDRYELRRDGSGLPYDSILDLRREKIHNYLNVTNWTSVRKFIPISYEDMLGNGTSSLLRKVQEAAGIRPDDCHCNATAPQPQRLNHRPLNESYVHYITEHIDWETEALIGYRPKEPTTDNNITLK